MLRHLAVLSLHVGAALIAIYLTACVSSAGGYQDAEVARGDAGNSSDAGPGSDANHNGNDAASGTDTNRPGSDAANGSDAAAGNDAASGNDAAQPASCTNNNFNMAFEYATTKEFGIQYLASDSLEAPQDLMMVQRYDAFGGPTQPGTYDLDGINYADCGLCLLIYSDCTGASCDKKYYAETGTVTITSIGGLGSRFTATLNNVVFEEVTIDPQTFVSTPVVGGDTWCVNGYNFDQQIRSPDDAVCSRPDVGCVGETMGDFQLQNCATEQMESVYALGAGKQALWFVLVTGWCPSCAQWVPQTYQTYNQRSGEGLQNIYVLGEDQYQNEPTLSYCRQYANQHGADPSLFYIDHDGETSFATTFAYLWPYLDSQGNLLLPWNALIDAISHNIAYADGAGGDLDTTLNQLLAD